MDFDFSNYIATIRYDFTACDMVKIKMFYRQCLKKNTEGVDDNKLCHELSNWLLYYADETNNLANLTKLMNELFPVMIKTEFYYPNGISCVT